MTSSIARVTIILRDIPKDVPEEEILQLFEGDKVQKVNPDIGNTWFVTFETEEDCLAAYEKCQLKCFRDEPLKARIKSENVLNRFVPADSPSFVPPFPLGTPMPAPYPQMMAGPFPGMPFLPPYAMDQFAHFQGRPFPGFMPGPGVPPHVAAALNANVAPGKGGFNNGWPATASTEDGNRSGRGKVRGKKAPAAAPQPKGYTGPYKQYQKEEIIAILCELIAKETDGGQRPDLPDIACVAPQQIRTLELYHNGDVGVQGEKTIVEAAISADDIKTAEKTYSRGSGRKQVPPAVLN